LSKERLGRLAQIQYDIYQYVAKNVSSSGPEFTKLQTEVKKTFYYELLFKPTLTI